MADDADIEDIKRRLAAVEAELTALRGLTRIAPKSVRKTSTTTVLGMPLYDIAFGPNLERGEQRGHARGFFAFGDIATGIVAVGGIARGALAIGGLTLGLVSVGGVAAGIVAALGGVAFGGLAIGGVAIGYYVFGGATVGVHSLGALRDSLQHVEFAHGWLHGVQSRFACLQQFMQR